MPFAAIWMELEIVILKEESHTEKEKFHEIPYMWNLKRNDTNELAKQNKTNRKQSDGCCDKDREKGQLGNLRSTCTHCCTDNG